MSGRNEVRRAELKTAYSSPNWEEKVDAMDEKQVAAIHARLLAQGKLKKK